MRRIFFDVIEVNIGISVIILLVCLLERKFRKRYGAGWLKMVWVLLAVRLLIPYNFSLPFTELRLLNDPQFEQEEEGLFPWQTTEKSMDTEALTVDTVTTESEYAQAQYSSADSANEQKRDESTDAFSLSYATIFTAIWIVGLGAGLWYFFIANINFYGKCKHTLRKIPECSLVNHINELQEQMLGKIVLPIFDSDVVSSPMLVGLITPKLVLPYDKEHWKEDELNWIVTHEICHYQSKDLWIKMVLMLVWCLNWFNPFVYIMKKRCYFHIELSCDEKVLKGHEKEKRGEYAGALLTFASGRQEVSSFTTHFGDSKKRMKKRIDNMLDMGKKRKGVVAFLILFLSMVVNCMCISCGYKPLEETGNDADLFIEEIEHTVNEDMNTGEDSTGIDNEGMLADITASGDEADIETTAPTAPTKEQVLDMRDAVLEGMSEAEKKRLAENIKVANQVMEKAYFYDNLFERLEDPEDLYWNYFEQKGDILIGYSKDMEPIMEYNRFDAENFVTLMQEMKDSLKSDLLKEDMDILIENTLLAKENHDVEYVKQIYRILHDMDYFLLRYGPEDVGKYTKDDSTVRKYYGVLMVYGEEKQ